MITFENIKTGEKVTFTGEQEVNARNAHMAAYLNSSDLSPNAGVRGQDFGWRLAPEVVAEMEAIRQDFDTLDRLSKRIGVGMDDLKDFHILSYVADRSFAEDARRARVDQPTSSELEDDYRARVKAAKSGKIEAQAINEGEKTVEYNEAADRGRELAKANEKAAKAVAKETAPVVEEAPVAEEATTENKGVKAESAKK